MNGETDLCFNAGSFYLILSMMGTLVTVITTLFGLLMMSYRSRIQTAEQREQDAYTDRDQALKERNEALWRLDDTRSQYRSFAEETQAVLPGPRGVPRRTRNRDT